MPDVMKTVGRYEILRELGRGGMALVYLARQTDLDRFVALKELGAFHASDASFAQRFLRESRVAGSLSHPNIVTVHDYFEHEGTPYIAMEYVERGSLRPYVGKMTLSQIGGVLEGLLAGLTNAEQNGIVHRDLKPENLMVTSDGRVKIADFGIAKATTKMQTGAFLTATGTTVGTPTYMAPEQAMAQDIGPWTDLYSVGCMAFEMFTGQGAVPRLRRADGDPAAARQRADPAREVDRPAGRPGHLGLDREAARQGPDAAHAVGRRRVGRLRGDHHRAARAALAPRARGSARRPGRRDTPNPLTPAPFQGTTAGAAASDEFQSFAWGQPAADTDGAAAASTPYTPPPQDLPVRADGGDARARGAARSAAEARCRARGAAAPEAPPAEAASDEPVADSGFVTFGTPAPAPPTDALVPPPAEAPPAPEPVAPEPEPEVVAPEPEPEPEPEPQAEVAEEPAQDAGFETYIAPPPPRPPTEEPGTDALQGVPPAPEPPAPEPAGPRAGRPGARAGRRVDRRRRRRPAADGAAPEPARPSRPSPRAAAAAAAYEYDPNATVMPEALREPKPEPKAKPKKERKPARAQGRQAQAPSPSRKPEPKPVREGEKPASKAFPIALARRRGHRARARLHDRRLRRRRRASRPPTPAR